ncbi:MAG: heme-copper oxidase subunit III [Deltaproteobacteria bacterium]|nr:heme-copper oxidase subunit III [Deltaproteobacteria bacterium]
MSASAALTTPQDHDDHHLAAKAWPEDPHFGVASAGKIGMWIFLLSDCLSFAGLLLAYGILRGGADTWRHAGEPSLGITFTAFLTFLLICSSVTMVFAYAAALDGNRSQAVRYLGLTVLGGVLFLCGQMQEYFGILHFVFGSEGLVAEGLHFGRSHYATTFFCITGFHGMHVFAGVTYLTVILVRTAKGKYDAGRVDHIEIAGLFWHFVDLIWILVFTLVYLIPE